MRLRFLTIVLPLLLMSCGPSQPKTAPFEPLIRDFVYGSLALSPVSATGAGYHRHNGISLDETLDDYGAAGIDSQRQFYAGIQSRIAGLDKTSLDAEQQADLEIIQNNLGMGFLELDTIQSYKHNPTVYVELAGNALYTPYVLNYAPQDQRFTHITRRLEKIPALFEQAKANLVDAPEVWNRVAREENLGNIELIDKTLREATPQSQKAEYARAAGPALAALRDFNTFLEAALSKKTSDWRLGKERYARKFAYVLSTGKTPEQLLAEAEAELKATRAEMAKLAAPQTVPQALDAIARQHATPDTYLEKARETLAQATAFVREKGLLTLPARDNLKVIETPEFMRGIYGVGGFNAAPALEPQLGAFYWVTPIPKTWPAERVESKLREYNDYGLQELTIHEAMPGHYVQLEYANDVQPVSRRLLRNVFANTPYVEGWAFYTQQMMSDEGYLGNSKPLRLTLLKQILRGLANTILDVRLQTMGMTDQQALDLMINDTYQEKEEATAKLQRAQLSSCQLPTYFAGWKGWLDVRDHEKQRRGGAFSLRDFHERALKESGVPLPVLDRLLQPRTRAVVRRDNVTIEVIAEGRGPLFVLLPSLGRDSEEFDPVAERIAAAGYRVLRPQPRGYGRSTGPMQNLTLHDYARDVAAVIEHENAGPAVLAGHAYGHFVARMTAVDFPKLTRAVILIGAAQKTPNPEVQRSVSIATDPSQPEAERLKHLNAVFFAPGNDPKPWLTGFHSDVRQAEVIARDATPQREYWSAGAAPILDIQGDNDPYRPPSSKNELVEEFGANRVSVVRIPHAAHAIIMEQPRAVADAIIAWVH